MMEEKYNLTWSTFTSHSRELFTGLLETGDLTDVTLVCDDLKELRAHKLILSGCSPVLRRIIFSHPQAQPVIHLRGTPYEDMRALVQFMYLGETAVAQHRVIKFLNLARDFGMKEIGRECAVDGKRKVVEEGGQKTGKQSRNQPRPDTEDVRKKIKTEKKTKISLPANIEIYPAVTQSTQPAPQAFLAESEMLINQGADYEGQEEEREEGEVIQPPPPPRTSVVNVKQVTRKKNSGRIISTPSTERRFSPAVSVISSEPRDDLKSHLKTSHF